MIESSFYATKHKVKEVIMLCAINLFDFLLVSTVSVIQARRLGEITQAITLLKTCVYQEFLLICFFNVKID